MAISNAKKMAYTQVLECVKYLNKIEYSRIPKELLLFYEENRLEGYSFMVDEEVPLKEQLSKEAKEVLSYLFIKYIATNDDKTELYAKAKAKVSNEKVEPRITTLGVEPLQNDSQKMEPISNQSIITRETWVQKLMNKIKKFLKRG